MDARPAARPAGDCSAGRGHQRRLGKQATLWFDEGGNDLGFSQPDIARAMESAGHIDAVHGL